MELRKTFILASLFFLLQAAYAQFYILDSQAIEISVDSVGNATIEEKYFFIFQNEEQLSEFREKVSEIGVSLDGWREYDRRIYPHIGRENEITVNGISFIESAETPEYLELSYSLQTPIMEKESETSRIIDYSLGAKHFAEFVDGGLWVIPAGTSITVKLPRGVEIEEPVRPDALVQENAVIWNGYVFGNELNLDYRFFKQIASFDLNQIVLGIVSSDIFWAMALAVALLFLVVVAKRKTLSQKVENYLIEHSDLGGVEEEE